MNQIKIMPAGGPASNENVQRLNGTNYNKPVNPRILDSQLDAYIATLRFLKQPTKRTRMIAWLIVAGNQQLRVTRFDAEHVGCHCWNTTASKIQRFDGIHIERQDTKRSTRFGTTHCKEYWLNSIEIQNAEQLLESLTVKGGA